MYVCTVVTSYPKWRFLSREIAVTPCHVKSHVGQSECAVGLRLPPKALSVIKVTSRRGCTSRVRGAKLFKTYVGVSKFRMIAKTQKLDLNCVEWKCAYSRSPMVYNKSLLIMYVKIWPNLCSLIPVFFFRRVLPHWLRETLWFPENDS